MSASETQALDLQCTTCASAAGWVSVAGNVLLAVVKWITGIVCNSQALIADALHSTVDILGSFITLIMLRLSKRKPSIRYPYGFKKLEDVSAMAIYIILIGVGTYIAVGAVRSIIIGRSPTPEFPALLAALLSIFVNMLMYYYISCAGRQTRSPSLIALGYENKVDAFSSSAAFVGILGGVVGFPFFDAAAAVVVSAIIIVESLRELHGTARKLNDCALPRPVRVAVEQAARSAPFVQSILAIKTRYLGATAHADIDIVVDPDISVEVAREIANGVVDRVRSIVNEVNSVRVFPHPARETSGTNAHRLLELLAVMKELRTGKSAIRGGR